ncbi:hypothetical protein D3C83_58800 [compost metagenome]
MQLGYLEGLFSQVDSRHHGAARGHRLGQDAAPAADVEDALAFEARDSIYVIQAQRIDVVQRLELGAGVPPAVGELAEFVELGGIDVDHA